MRNNYINCAGSNTVTLQMTRYSKQYWYQIFCIL